MGEIVENFVGIDQHGKEFDLAVAKKPAVIFFYPKASTPICTAQSCAFSKLSDEFEALGATVVGVSNDNAEAQKAFDEKNNLDLRLLCDNKGSIAAKFGLNRKMGLPPKRSTVIVGENMEVLDIFKSEREGAGHADWALEFLKNR